MRCSCHPANSSRRSPSAFSFSFACAFCGQSSRTRCKAAMRKHAARWLFYTWWLLRALCNRPCSMAMSVAAAGDSRTHVDGCKGCGAGERAGGRAFAWSVWLCHMFFGLQLPVPLVFRVWLRGHAGWVTCTSACVTSKSTRLIASKCWASESDSRLEYLPKSALNFLIFPFNENSFNSSYSQAENNPNARSKWEKF